jgi:flagellar hook-associated protein 2
MAITAPGIGTGLDIKSLVDQLVSAERQPAASRITKQEARANAELSALGQLKSALAALRDATTGVGDLDALRKRSVSISPKDILTATATTRAATGRYDIEVVALATAQRLASGAFASADTAVGTGTLSISVGGVPLQVAIDAGNNTLAGIRDAINRAPGNTGVRASVVTADGGSYLLLAATAPGTAAAITVDALEAGSGLEALEFGPGTSNGLTEQQPATDAEVRIEGLTVTSSGNTITGAIEGLSINLQKAAAGTTVTVAVANDAVAIKQSVKGFVDAYNGVIDTVKRVTAFNAENRSAAPLLGDGQTRGIVASLRSAFAGALGGSGNAFASLVDVGIRSEVTGRLTIDVARLDAAIDRDPESLARVFAADSSGLADRLGSVFTSVLDGVGSLTSREQRIQAQLKQITTDRQRLDLRMDQVRRRLERQFNSLDSLVQQLNSSGKFLLQALGQG